MNNEEFIRKIYSDGYVNKQIKKVKMLGTKSNIKIFDLLIVRMFSSFVLFVVFLLCFKYGYLIAPFFAIVYYIMFNKIALDNRIKKRTIKLESEAMHFFEVLTLSLETGRNLVEAIDVTTDNVSGILSMEFKETVREVDFGKSLNEALTDMQARIPSDTINNILLSLTESNLYGNSIIKNLYNQIDFLREKRKMEVKGKISKVPIIISVISVLFFIPLLLLIILGPILLEYLG